VRVGVIIPFFGVAFLLKHAARNMFPIVMLVLGWRLRHSREKYALALQGGAVGVLYLTVNPGTYTIAYGYSEPSLRGPSLDVALEQLGTCSAGIKPEIIKTSQSFDLRGKESLLAKKQIK